MPDIACAGCGQTEKVWVVVEYDINLQPVKYNCWDCWLGYYFTGRTKLHELPSNPQHPGKEGKLSALASDT